MDLEKTSFDSWAIVEVMGHARFAGRVSEQSIGGASFIRCDVPAVDGSPAFTKLFGASAIYSITPVTEELARKAVKACHSEPISVYIPAERRITETAVAETTAGDEITDHHCVSCGKPCDCRAVSTTQCSECSACQNADDDE